MDAIWVRQSQRLLHLILLNLVLDFESVMDTLNKRGWSSTLGQYVRDLEEDGKMQAWKVLADTRHDLLDWMLRTRVILS